MPNRVNEPGWRGFNGSNQQQCLTCWAWQFPVLHSCPGVPRYGATPPPAPRRVQLRRAKGWRIPEGVLVVDRRTRWGNPFAVTDCAQTHHDRKHWHVYRVDQEGVWLATHWSKTAAVQDAVLRYRDWVTSDPARVAAIRLLFRGQDLGCWCPEGQPCHAGVLLEIANTQDRIAREAMRT